MHVCGELHELEKVRGKMCTHQAAI